MLRLASVRVATPSRLTKAKCRHASHNLGGVVTPRSVSVRGAASLALDFGHTLRSASARLVTLRSVSARLVTLRSASWWVVTPRLALVRGAALSRLTTAKCCHASLNLGGVVTPRSVSVRVATSSRSTSA